MQRQHLVIFLCVLTPSSVICPPIHLFYAFCGFQKYQIMFNQNIYPREKSNSHKCFLNFQQVWKSLKIASSIIQALS